MRVQHNVNAQFLQRQQAMKGKVILEESERLAVGKRINRASDDAAGLAVSEKMKAQIIGLNQASRNISDGLSLIQTADAAIGTMQDRSFVGAYA